MSMKTLDFKTRSIVAKYVFCRHRIPLTKNICFIFRECINKVCEAAGLKTVDKKRKVDRKVQKAIAETPNMTHAGTNVTLKVSSVNLSLTSLENNQVIAHHEMPKISFASGGDSVSCSQLFTGTVN